MTDTVRAHVPRTFARLGVEDVPDTVKLHQQLLPHGFFVELGPSFLQAYHHLFMDGPQAYTEVVRVGDSLAGALVGTLNHEGHAQWTTRRVPRLAWIAAVAMARHPALFRRFVRSRLRRYCRILVRRLRGLVRISHDHASRGNSGSTEQVAVLSHVFVDPAWQGDGLGRALVDNFITAARAAGADRAELVTLHGDEGAGDFYAAHGWRPRGGLHLVDGRAFQTYTYML